MVIIGRCRDIELKLTNPSLMTKSALSGAST